MPCSISASAATLKLRIAVYTCTCCDGKNEVVWKS